MEHGEILEATQTNTPAPVIEEADLFTYEDDTDKAMGILTARYTNGGITKKTTLSDGRIAECRRLKGNSRVLIQRIIGNDESKVKDALTAVCTKIDGKEIVLEDLDSLWFNDLTTVQTMALSLNFL